VTSTKYQTVADTDALPTEYLLGDRLPKVPRGDVTVMFGDGGTGKGRLNAWMIKRVTADGGTVVGVWPEDHPNEQVRPRLEAAGLTDEEMGRVVNLTRLPGSGRFKISADITHAGDMPLLREQVLPDLAADGHDVRMLIIDPLAAVVGWGSIQTNAGARRAVEPIQDLCADTGIAGLIVAHTTKEGILQGSAGLLQAVRLAYKVSRDRNDPEIRVIHADKANNLPAQEDLMFRLEDDDNGNAKVVFLDTLYVEAKQRQWRTPIFRAVLAGPEGTRELGRFTDVKDAVLTAAAQPETPGPALTWHQHVRADKTIDMYTISASFMMHGNPYAVAVSDMVKARPLTAQSAAA
jgi:predicted ATP-dependent serine protease